MNVTSSNPEITIGILCYNAENTIQQAIKCALEQNYPAFEIIILDDASTDSSHSKIKPFLGNPRIRFIQHVTNKGQGMARNSVINAARGEFVAFFDDDDVSDPHRLETQKNTILSNEVRFKTVKVACYASGCRVYPNGYVVKSQAIGSVGNTPPNGVGVAKYLLAFDRKKGWFYGAGTPTSGLMIRRSLLMEAGGFDPKLRRVEDVDLAVRLALMGAYFVGSSKPLVKRYMTDSGYKSPADNLVAEQQLAMKYKEFLLKEGLYYHAHKWPELRFLHFTRNYLRFILTLTGLLMDNPIRTTQHLFATGPKRFIHEAKINAKHIQQENFLLK